MVGAAGTTILFVCLLVLQTIIGFVILSYASRCFFLVVEETAAGNDEIIWTREPITDWFWKLFYLAWLAGVWLVPTWLVLRFVHPPVLEDYPGLGFVAISVGVIWLLFPISLLSSLAAGTPLAVLYVGLLRRLGRHLLAVIGLYLSSALLLAGSAALIYYVMVKGWAILLLPVAAMAAAAVALIYARLLGRVALLFNLRSAEEPEPTAEPRKRKRARKRRSTTGAEIYDPWEVPKEEPRSGKKKRGAYGIKDYVPSPETPDEPPTGEAYEVKPPPPTAKAPPPLLSEEHPVIEKVPMPGGPTQEDELERREGPPPLPSMPLVHGVYSFPWYRATLATWIILSLGLLLMGGVLRLQILFSPF